MMPRKFPRFDVELPVSFTGDHEGDGMVTNLSVGGCRVQEPDVTVDVKAMLTLRLRLSFDEPPLKIDAARVCWSGGHAFGLEFMIIGAEEQQRLHRFLLGLPHAKPDFCPQTI